MILRGSFDVEEVVNEITSSGILGPFNEVALEKIEEMQDYRVFQHQPLANGL